MSLKEIRHSDYHHSRVRGQREKPQPKMKISSIEFSYLHKTEVWKRQEFWPWGYFGVIS